MVKPKLEFNDAMSKTLTDVSSVADTVAAIIPKIDAFSPLNGNEDFWLKIASVDINGLRLLSYAQSGVYFERENFVGANLIIPTGGSSSTEISGVGYDFVAGETAFFSAEEPNKRRCVLNQSGVDMRLDIDRLNSTYASFMGLHYTGKINLNTRTPALADGKIPFFRLFQIVYQQIDAVGGDAEILKRMSLDDSLYRLAVGLLHPNVFSSQIEGEKFNTRFEINNLCEFLRANLTNAVSLTEMERVSGLSARVLQYSFQSQFGLRPKEWIRRERLHAARALLLKCFRKITVTSVAYRFCFSSPSEFGQFYLKEFGEFPSATLRRKQ